MQNEDRLHAIERATDVPLLVLALLMIPLLLVPLIGDPSDNVERVVVAADWLIWSAFAVDFGVKLAVAPRRIYYIRTHPLEGAMVLLPFLRPLRLARFLRLARVATALGINVTIPAGFVASTRDKTDGCRRSRVSRYWRRRCLPC